MLVLKKIIKNIARDIVILFSLKKKPFFRESINTSEFITES